MLRHEAPDGLGDRYGGKGLQEAHAMRHGLFHRYIQRERAEERFDMHAEGPKRFPPVPVAIHDHSPLRPSVETGGAAQPDRPAQLYAHTQLVLAPLLVVTKALHLTPAVWSEGLRVICQRPETTMHLFHVCSDRR